MKPSICYCVLLVVVSITFASAQSLPIFGTKAIPGDYPTLSAAINAINSYGMSGPVVLELQPTYSSLGETFPIQIGNMPGNSAINTLTIRPAITSSGILVSSTINNSIIDLMHASNIIIDGRPGGTGDARELIIRNYGGRAIRFADGSCNNVLKYCVLQGINGQAIDVFGTDGVVYFDGYSNSTIGNKFNTISNCLISDDGSGNLYGAIYASGNSKYPNSDNTLRNNEIVNFSGFGIYIGQDNGGNWVINDNSFYNNLSIPVYNFQTGIFFAPGPEANGNSITGNFIGGQLPQAGGGKWTSTSATEFTGIYVSSGIGSGTSLHNNTISNFAFASDGETNLSITLISIASGITGNNGNVIGSVTEANSITLAGSTTFTGILVNSTSPVSVTGDFIGNITATGVMSTFSGIKYSGTTGVNISGNTLKYISTTTMNDIEFEGIYIKAGSSNSSLHDNVIQSITLTTNASIVFRGISLTKGIPQGVAYGIIGNNGNVIGSVTEANNIILSGSVVQATGIFIDNSSDVSITDDHISNITVNGNLESVVNGIFYTGNGNALIEGNTLHHLTGLQVKGINIGPSPGSSTVTLLGNIVTGNNMGIGIQASAPESVTLVLNETNNMVSNWNTGFFYSKDPSGVLQQSFHDNSISGNQVGVDNQSDVQLDMTCSWWGDASGPGGEGPGTGDPVSANVVFSPWSTSSDFISVNAGNEQTVYLGYGSQSVILTATALACGDSVEYLWSTGSTTQSITVSPLSTASYSVTVKDNLGHNASDNVTVIVKDIRCGANKINVCHKGKSICISGNDVAAHLNHGDYLGPCYDIEASSRIARNELDESETLDAVSIFPNPVNDVLFIQVNVNGFAEVVAIQIFDLMGRKLKEEFFSLKNSSLVSIKVEEFSKGPYHLVVRSHNKIESLKFIK